MAQDKLRWAKMAQELPKMAYKCTCTCTCTCSRILILALSLVHLFLSSLHKEALKRLPLIETQTKFQGKSL